MEMFWPFSWIIIPVIAILAGTFKEWLQFKEKQNQLGSSTENLEIKVESLSKALEESESHRLALIERIQNLETIVTSQEWDSLDTDQLALTEKEQPKKRLLDDLNAEEDSITHSRAKASRLAKRLGT